jgi:VWFA-related protein
MQVNNAMNSPDFDECDTCTPMPAPGSEAVTKVERADSDPAYTTWNRMFTIHQTVDETALFFSVTHHGHAVNDLSVSDIQVRDNDKPPNRILQFAPQSQLPLRLGLLIDTSESVQYRIEFEERAAEKFLDKVLTNDSDLAFVEGFHDQMSVTQDFTRDLSKLKQGIEKLTSGGDGTAIFDAVFQACWKLSAYPDQGRTAKVLVVITDGEDNSSHRSLRQAIDEAEAAGVTVYTLSTAERLSEDSDADGVLKLMAERTGGKSLFPGNLRALDSHLNQLERAIRSRYLIAYKAAGFRPDGKFRSIRVSAEKNGEHLHVQVRKGYYARAVMSPN